MFVFSSGAAGAGVISADGLSGWGTCVASRPSLGIESIHDVGWRALVFELISHRPHDRIDVLEEHPVPFAKIIQARLSFRSDCEAIFQAAAIANEPDCTLPTQLR